VNEPLDNVRGGSRLMALTCRDCGARLLKPLRGRWPERCGSCVVSWRNLQQRSQPSRRSVCACGKPRISRAAVCKQCRSRARRRLVPCPRCEKRFWPWEKWAAHARKFCSTKCARWPIRAAARLAAREAARQKRCLWCQKRFRASTIRQKFCSDPCNNIAKSNRRKQLLRGARQPLPSLWEVYRRDQGRCGLCRRRVNRTLRWPNKLAASLDHIVPLSLGGRDEPSNIQLAHLGCNMTKQAKPCGSQMRLSW
jgi:hypothetical protein